MVDRLYADPSLAELYDRSCAGREDFGFYLPLVMAAPSVLDVACGTGELLRRASEAGHAGRLCGLDPAAAMLAVARRRTDIEWIEGDLESTTWDAPFELVVMTGHAFQVLVDDAALRNALASVRAALTDGGRFAFETRNPAVREWEQWTRDGAIEFVAPDGTTVRKTVELAYPVTDGVVHFSQTFSGPRWERPQVSWSTLRFLDPAALASSLTSAGLAVAEQFGDWDGQPLTDASPEIITIAKRA
ncbi:MAG TPA: class I SAM-dependent methyltransferase [Acidimicrobiia bacterium]